MVDPVLDVECVCEGLDGEEGLGRRLTVGLLDHQLRVHAASLDPAHVTPVTGTLVS
jgi:hypothetical protein